MEGSMLGTCLRRLVVLLSLVAIASFAGHGSAMAAPGPMGLADHHSSTVSAAATAHADADVHSGHVDEGGSKIGDIGAMACCGKSCTSLLPFPLPPEVAVRSDAAHPEAIVRDDGTGIQPQELKRPPKLG